MYPETGDLVLAGPAGDWTVGGENRVVSRDTGDPVVRLDDLVVIFRHMMTGRDAQFGCMINPRQESLKNAHRFPRQVCQAAHCTWSGRPQLPGASSSAPRSARKTSRSSADWIRRPGPRGRWSKPTIA